VNKPPPESEKRLELIGDALAVVDAPEKTPGFDPYDQSSATPSIPGDESKTLSPAAMRRLSETIKGSRTWTAPKKTTDTSRQLAALCSDLERMLAQLAVLVEPTGEKVPDLMARLSDAARYLEDAIDCLSLPADQE
jgi:hypothetical protein